MVLKFGEAPACRMKREMPLGIRVVCVVCVIMSNLPYDVLPEAECLIFYDNCVESVKPRNFFKGLCGLILSEASEGCKLSTCTRAKGFVTGPR